MMTSTPTNIFSCFKDRVVLITGAGGSLGSDAAVLFAQYGAHLVLIDNHAGRLETIVNKLKRLEIPQEKVLGTVGDAGSQDDMKQLVEDAISKFGKIDHLINVVGVRILGDMTTVGLDALDDSLADIRITFNVTKACLPHLLQSKGSVVNVSSVASCKVYPLAVGYSTAKAGLNHMSKVFASDLASKGVRVNTIVLTAVRSDYTLITGHLNTEEEREAYLKVAAAAVPLGRVAEKEEVTNTVLFLCSNAASFITGVVLPIDGGYTLSNTRQI